MSETFLSLFKNKKPIMAMLHMKGNHKESPLERAKLELQEYLDNGVDSVIVEDYFGSKKDCILMLEYLHDNFPNLVYGVNLLRSSPEEVFEVAKNTARNLFRLILCAAIFLLKKISSLKKNYKRHEFQEFFLSAAFDSNIKEFVRADR